MFDWNGNYVGRRLSFKTNRPKSRLLEYNIFVVDDKQPFVQKY